MRLRVSKILFFLFVFGMTKLSFASWEHTLKEKVVEGKKVQFIHFNLGEKSYNYEKQDIFSTQLMELENKKLLLATYLSSNRGLGILVFDPLKSMESPLCSYVSYREELDFTKSEKEITFELTDRKGKDYSMKCLVK